MKVVLTFLWFMYFLQGIPYGFQTKFLPVFLRSHSLSLSLISFTRLLSLPWILKPMWAPFVDRFGRKSTWIALCLIGMAFLYLAASFATTLNQLYPNIVVIAGLNILASTQDIAVDSIIVDLLPTDQIGLGNIAQVVGYKSGLLVGGGILGWLSSTVPWQRLFFLLFLTYLFSASLFVLPFYSKLTKAPMALATKDHRVLDGKGGKREGDSWGHVGEAGGKIWDHKGEGEGAGESWDHEGEGGKRWDHEGEGVGKRWDHEGEGGKSWDHEGEGGEGGKTWDHEGEGGGAGTSRDHEGEGGKSWNQESNEREVYMQTKSNDNANTSVFRIYCNVYRKILKSPGTKWTIVYVLIYKLGEQGIVAMFPMFLIDQGLSPSQTATLTGVWCQICSIVGSLMAGMIVRPQKWDSLRNTLTSLSSLRLLIAGFLIWCASYNNALESTWLGIVFFDCVLHLISGAITTVTFTMMVLCSRQCTTRDISATHYSTLATFEVLGKLTMTSISGTIAETTGYKTFFLICFFLLSFPVIILRIRNNFTDSKKRN